MPNPDPQRRFSKAIESAALRLGLVLELQYSARSLFPPSQYSGLTLQLIRVMPGRQRGTSSQVHRVHSLLEMKQGQCVCWSVHCNFTGEGKCN